MKLKTLAACAVMAVLAAACGGGGGTAGATGAVALPAANPGGIWSGTLTVSGITRPIIGLVTEDGEGAFYDSANQTIYRIRGGVASGNDFSAPLKQFVNDAEGSVPANGTLSGTVSERNTLAGSFTLPGQTGSFALNYDMAIYEADVSFGHIAGNYRFTIPVGAASGVINMVIDTGGGITVIGEDSECHGLAEFVDEAYNAIRFEFEAACAELGTGLAWFIPGNGTRLDRLVIEADDATSFAVWSEAERNGGGGASTGGGSTTGSTTGTTTGGGGGGGLLLGGF